MKAIGFKRLMILLSVLGMNLAVACVYFLVVAPMLEETAQQLSATSAQISQTRGKIQNIKADLAEYQKNLPRYQVLLNAGFFSGQDRLELTSHFQRVQERSGLRRFSFVVENLQSLYTLPAGKENLRVLSSRIKISNPIGYFDTDFYMLIELMKTVFPSHVHFVGFNLERTGPVSTEMLKRMAAKDNEASLIKGDATFQWLTIIPEPKEQEDPTDSRNSRGGRR